MEFQETSKRRLKIKPFGSGFGADFGVAFFTLFFTILAPVEGGDLSWAALGVVDSSGPDFEGVFSDSFFGGVFAADPALGASTFLVFIVKYLKGIENL